MKERKREGTGDLGYRLCAPPTCRRALKEIFPLEEAE